MTALPEAVGPVLFARGADEHGSRLSAIVVALDNRNPPLLVTCDGQEHVPVRLHSQLGRTVWRYDFWLRARRNAAYRLGEAVFPVAACYSEDVRIAFVSCNGQEHGDAARLADERNAMWRRLAGEHDSAPFGLLLHGGDQLYADEVVRSHPDLLRWAAGTQRERAGHTLTADIREAAENYYFRRYLTLYTQPEFAYLGARVPALMMWDDHDIFDGWGSLPDELLDGHVGRCLFAVARRTFMLFQLGATDEMPPAGWDDGQRRSLTHAARFPRFSIVAPDLRSERRLTQVMGTAGWAAFERAIVDAARAAPILIMSSVPVLGPRLSWIEKLMDALPSVHKYADDLHDQWQSRSHRREWRRMLETLEQRAAEGRNMVVVLSGEIHFATRGEMTFKDGTVMHQLVASGIAHPPPPRSYARALGLLATLGENPLVGREVRLKPVPGQRQIYAAERNYLVLERRGEEWSASWELEESGRTPAMRLSGAA